MTAIAEIGVVDALREIDDLLASYLGDMATRVDAGTRATSASNSMAISAQLKHFMATGGKRLRPSMCYWGWVAAGGGPGRVGAEQVVRAGAAIELLHAFALIHDDVMDQSARRRGRPSLHERLRADHQRANARGSAHQFGMNMAILVGDLAHAAADQLAAGLSPSMQTLWNGMVLDLVSGQHLDLQAAARGPLSMAEVSRVAALKSGSYTVTGPLRLGAAAAGAPAHVHDILSTYGRLVGEAFAFRDDLLGVWGDPNLTGKPTGDDLREGKQTVVLALAREQSDRIGGCLAKVGCADLSDTDISVLKTRMEQAGVRTDVERLISGNVDAAIAELESAPLTDAGKRALIGMAERLAWRDR